MARYFVRRFISLITILAAITAASWSPYTRSAASTSPPVSWEEVTTRVAQFTQVTRFCEIVERLGRPYARHPTISAPDEYILYFRVPQHPELMFWLMLDTESERFLYWSAERQPVFQGESDDALARNGLSRDGSLTRRGSATRKWTCS